MPDEIEEASPAAGILMYHVLLSKVKLSTADKCAVLFFIFFAAFDFYA